MSTQTPRTLGAVKGAGRGSRVKVLSAILGCAFLAACSPTLPIEGQIAPGGPKAPLTLSGEVKSDVIAMAHARAIEKNCYSGFDQNQAADAELKRALEDAAAAQGYRSISASQVVLTIAPLDQVKAIGLAYEKERGIVRGNAASWCAAGQYEVTHRTRVGKYLIAR